MHMKLKDFRGIGVTKNKNPWKSFPLPGYGDLY
jgi:hypothetical protein